MELNLSIKDKFYDEKGSTFSVSKPDIYDDYRRTMDAEMFEKLVHDIILTKYSDCSETNEFILSLPKREQRLAIMSLIDGETKGDNNLLWSEMKAYVDSRPDKMEHLKDVIRIINKFVKDGSVEKKTYGEVLTPISLVNEMLETLPKEVWSNPDLKWLDPANGSGNFPFVVMYKLMKGLSEWEPDPEKRYKHIVENMIYVCELQSRNVFLWLCGIDPFDEYTTNTYWGSFLDEGFDKHMKEVWGVDKFDLVVGNPPYNNDGGLKTGGKNLYQKFILKSISIYSGYICYVTPPGFYKTTVFDKKNEIFKDITTNNNLKYLNCTDINGKYFNVGTPIVYYLIENKKYQKNTKIESDYGLFFIDVSEYNFIPRLVSNESFSILKKISSKGKRIESYRDDKCKISVDSFLTLSTMNHLSSKGLWNVEVGNVDNRKRIIIKTNEPIKLKKVIDSKIYRFLFYAYRHDGAVYHNFISGFRVPEDLNVDLYEYFEISDKEKNFMDKILKF
jgi:hypothetical protein